MYWRSRPVLDDGYSSDGDGGCDYREEEDERQPSTRRWWGRDRKGGRSLSDGQTRGEMNDIMNCCDPPSEVYNVYDDDWDGSVEWIYQLFDAAFEVLGERAPRIKEIEQLYIPGLMTANKRLRTYWGLYSMRWVWHGTSDSAADSIGQEGFDVGHCHKCDAYGHTMRRVWFHEDARFATTFATSAKHRDWSGTSQRPPRSFVMVLALVATPTDTSPHTWIFRNDQAVPVYKVTYAYPKRRRG